MVTFTSGLVVVVVVRGDTDGKLPLSGAAGTTELGTLVCIKLGNGSLVNTEGGTGGRLEGTVDPSKGVEIKLAELVEVGKKGDEYSGKFEEGRLGAPLDKDALKLGYCIGCCIEGGIESPVVGRNNDC